MKQGETLTAIAERYSVSTRDLSQWNSLRGTYIKRGMELKVYAQSVAKGDETPKNSGATSSEEGDGTMYTVRSGDTLYSIARRYGLTVEQMKKLNPTVTGNTARLGQVLKVK